MKKSFRLLLALLLIGGFAMSFSSCSDKDVNETEVFDPSDPYGKTTDDAEALLAIMHATAGIDSLPNDWNKANYKEEPAIGKVLDEANPYVRSTGAASAEEAISFFNSITSSSVLKTATSASWSKDGIGSINLNVINKDGVYATIDMHIQQLPHLTQIRFIDKDLLGENADNKPAYYHMGDVVSTVEDGQTIYWVCVRSCNKSFGKEKSHWVSFQLSDQNYKTYEADASNNRAQLILPDKLSSSKDVTEDIENAVKLFVALDNPSAYDEQDVFKDGLGGFKKVTTPTSMIRRIKSQWRDKGIKEKLLPSDVIENNYLTYSYLISNLFELPFFYYGHSKSIFNNIKLHRVSVAMSKTYITTNINHAEWKWDTDAVNIKSFVQNGTRIAGNIVNPVEKTDIDGLVIRCKTGKELCGKGDWKGNDPDYTKPFPADAPTKVTEVYRYDESAPYVQDFQFGDIAESADGAIWTCIASPCSNNNKTIFITTDNITYSADKKFITNSDLASINDIYYVFPILAMLKENKAQEYIKDFYSYYLTRYVPVDQYIQLRSYKGMPKLAGYHTTFAVRSTDQQHQQLLRMIWDGSDRINNLQLKGFTCYQDQQKMYLEDAGNMDLVNKYIKNDSISQNYWFVGKNGPTYRTKAGHSTVDSYLYYRKNTEINGQTYKGFADPDDYYSIFMEPVAILRVRILEPGETTNLTLIDNSVDDQKEFQRKMEQIIFQMFPITIQPYTYLDGSRYSMSYTGQ